MMVDHVMGRRNNCRIDGSQEESGGNKIEGSGGEIRIEQRQVNYSEWNRGEGSKEGRRERKVEFDPLNPVIVYD